MGRQAVRAEGMQNTRVVATRSPRETDEARETPNQPPMPAVIGEGHSLETHTPFYLVTSRSVPGQLYVVYQLVTRLQCTCQAGRLDKPCVHRAVVRDFLLDRMVGDSPGHPGDTAPLRRSSRPFSLMKT